MKELKAESDEKMKTASEKGHKQTTSLTEKYTKETESLQHKESVLRASFDEESDENGQLRLRLETSGRAVTRVRKDWQAYVTMTQERDNKSAIFKKKSGLMRNSSYQRLATKEKESKKMYNATQAAVSNLHAEALAFSQAEDNSKKEYVKQNKDLKTKSDKDFESEKKKLD